MESYAGTAGIKFHLSDYTEHFFCLFSIGI